MENNDLRKKIELLKIHFDQNGDDLAARGRVSNGSFYRMLKGDYTEKTLLSFCQNLGVSYEWMKYDQGEMIPMSPGDYAAMGQAIYISGKIPNISTNSSSNMVQELIRQVNEQKQEIEHLRAQLEKKEKQLDMFIEKYVKLEATDLKPHVEEKEATVLPFVIANFETTRVLEFDVEKVKKAVNF